MCGLRAHIQNHVVVGHVFHLLGDRLGRLGKFLGRHHIHRNRNVYFLGNFLCGGNQIFFIERLAHRMTRRRQEGVGDTTTDHQLVDHIRQRFQHFQLGGHLGTTNDGHQRFRRCVQRLAQGVELIGQQRAGTGHRCELAHPMGRRLRTVSGTEGIHHIDITQRGHFL